MQSECAVQSERWLDNPVYVDASVGGQLQTKYEPLPSNESLKKALVNLQKLNNGGCGEFLNAVLKNMKIKRKINGKKVEIDTIEKLFDYITGTKKINFVAEEVKQTTFFLGQKPEPVAGLSHNSKGDIALRRVSEAINSSTKYLYQVNRAHIMIHEMLHRVNQSHEKMYKAGRAALSAEERENFVSSGDASKDFTEMMTQKCGSNPNDPDEVKANLVQ
ncbi:hypothetical protein BH20ACI4_BH20ACI4_30090 [soil metagenome]